MPNKKTLANTSRRLLALGFVVVVALIAMTMAGMFSDEPNKANDGKLSVVTTYYPLYDFAKNIGGDKVAITNVTPSGAEPHDYEPSPKQLIDAKQADVFIYNGAHLESWVDKFLESYDNRAVKASKGITLLSEDKADVKDPHFWLDPVLSQQVVDTIKDSLTEASPGDASYFAKNAEDYQQQLEALHFQYSKGLASCKQRSIVTSHNAFAYIAKRYDLDVYSISGLSPDDEPSPKKLVELSNLVKEKQLKYVFFEHLVSSRLADTIATEADAKTLVFDPIEGLSDEAQKSGQNYLTIQRQNLENLRTALDCE